MRELVLVEPDDKTAESIARLVTSLGYRSRSVGSASDARLVLERECPDCAVVELSLPDQDGLVLIPWISHHCPRTAILVTSFRQSQTDVVLALKMGADDYLTKPFDAAEFEARLDRVIARAQPRAIGPAEPTYRIGDLVVNKVRGRVEYAGQPIATTPTEFRILMVLAARSGETVSRRTIVESVWGGWIGEDDSPSDLGHLADTHIGRIRQKLKKAGGSGVIRTVWGVGFSIPDGGESET